MTKPTHHRSRTALSCLRAGRAAWAIAAAVVAAPALAAAQGPATAGTSGQVAEGPAPAPAAAAPAPAQPQPATTTTTGDRCQDRRDLKWIRRCKPERNTWELGGFGGVFFTGGSAHELFDPVRQLASFKDGDPSTEWFKPYRKAAPELGLRVAYYPFSFLGGELEGGMMPTRIVIDGQPADRAILFNFRAHAIAQLPFWRVAPFVLVGGGGLGTTGALGNDVDQSVHFGGGVKVFLNHRTALRLDVRDVVGARKRVDAGAVSYPEVLLGVSMVLGRKSQKQPPKDSDGDGFLDHSDACPFEPGIAPDGCPERDRDGDGFMDSQDTCPDVPGIAPDGCPERDRDGDGFLDSKDRCPDVPGVAPDGCPIPDTDGDGLLDDVDKCVDKPETRNGFEDHDGCPDEIPIDVGKITGVVRGIYFDLDRDSIKPRSRPVLDRAVEVFKTHSSVKIEISGHTDSTGGVEYNRDLSRRRAESVRRYLVEQGIDGARITTRGAGPDEPIDTNRTPQGRAKNRRIEFTLLVE